MRLLDRAHLYGPVTIEFFIPGAKGRRITVKAVPSWSAERMFGMRYLSMEGESRLAYDKWLASMQVSWFLGEGLISCRTNLTAQIRDAAIRIAFCRRPLDIKKRGGEYKAKVKAATRTGNLSGNLTSIR